MLMRPLEAPPFPRPPYMTILTHTHTRDHHLHHHHPPPSHPPPHHHHHHCSNQTECKSLPGRGRSHTISYAKQQPLGVMQCNTMQHNMVMQCINVMQEMYLNAMQCMGTQFNANEKEEHLKAMQRNTKQCNMSNAKQLGTW